MKWLFSAFFQYLNREQKCVFTHQQAQKLELFNCFEHDTDVDKTRNRSLFTASLVCHQKGSILEIPEQTSLLAVH